MAMETDADLAGAAAAAATAIFSAAGTKAEC